MFPWSQVSSQNSHIICKFNPIKPGTINAVPPPAVLIIHFYPDFRALKLCPNVGRPLSTSGLVHLHGPASMQGYLIIDKGVGRHIDTANKWDMPREIHCQFIQTRIFWKVISGKILQTLLGKLYGSRFIFCQIKIVLTGWEGLGQLLPYIGLIPPIIQISLYQHLIALILI